jgi:hypothetical protein
MKKPALFGKYLLLERLNVGGMAEVFAAKSFGVEGFERILAIKKILPTMAEDQEFITMFIDEARISAQLSHANIVHIHDFGKHDEAYYIAMEYVSGKDLRALLERFRRRRELMPTAMAVFIATRICEGLDYAHRKKDVRGQPLGIIHRDVSPQNILLSYDGEVKIIDFGIAKAAGRQQRTQAGILKGKFGYMSPEQVRGHEIDRRSDLFALGVILYELLTGEKLFVGESDFSTLEKVRQADVAAPRQFNPDIPAGLERVVLKTLARETVDRYQWASDLQEDLMRFLLAGEAIYSPKHLAAFMKDAFAEDLLREGEKLERFAAAERPPEAEPSGLSVSAGRPAGARRGSAASQPQGPAARPRPLPVVSPSSGEGALAIGPQRKAPVVAPPTPGELGAMDTSDDRTVIVSEGLGQGPGGTLQTAIGSGSPDPARVHPVPGKQVLPAVVTRAPTAPLFDSIDPTFPRLAGARSPGARSPADTGHDLQPIEMTGFRPALPSDSQDTERPPPPLDETLLPGRNRAQILIGESPISGTTSLALSPASRSETRLFSEAPASRPDERGDTGGRTRLDAPRPRGADQPDSTSLLEEAPPRPGPRAAPRRLPPRPASVAKARRRRLWIAIAASGTLALLVVGAVVVKVTLLGAKSGVLPGAAPGLRYLGTVEPGHLQFTEASRQVELEPGEYTVEANAVEAGYLPARRRFTVSSGAFLPLRLEFHRQVMAAPPPEAAAPEPGVGPPEVQAPPLGRTEASAWTAVIRTEEPGVDIFLSGKRVGTTPGVVLGDLVFGKAYVGQARKPGFEVLNFKAENPERLTTLEVPLRMVHAAATSPRSPALPTETRRLEARAAPLARLACTSNPVGAEVLIDGRPTGRTTPIPRSQALELPVGAHRIAFRLKGSSSVTLDFTLSEQNRDTPLVLRADLPPAGGR